MSIDDCHNQDHHTMHVDCTINFHTESFHARLQCIFITLLESLIIVVANGLSNIITA